MKEAFIIMQIGNSELDSICSQVIVPVLKSCGLDPKRVDKHNEGRLLKSEIVRFIESSTIIVADLTNERPNCYLEVGYVMGKGKYENLILSAREDHSHDSPNHKKGGPKVHFDLSGYDILFWDPKKLEKFREDLEKRVRKRLKILESHSPVSGLENGRFSKDREIAFLGLKEYGGPGFMEICIALLDLLDFTQGELQNAARKVVLFHIPFWPPLLDVSNVKPTTNGIMSELNDHIYVYWSIRKDGSFYYFGNFLEDYNKKRIRVSTRISRVYETLVYSTRLYTGLGVPKNSSLAIGIRHGGFKDYNLSVSLDPVFDQVEDRSFPKISEEDEVFDKVETTLEEMESNLIDIVEKLTKQLFTMFDFYEVKKETLERIIKDFEQGRVYLM